MVLVTTEKNGSQYYNSDIDYSSSPIGSSLMARKHTFMADGDNKDVMQEEVGDKSTPSFDESISSPIGERLMLRKRIHSNSNLGKKSWSTSSGTNIPQQGINKPRRGWSEDSSDSDSNNSNKDKRPFNVKNTSSPIGSRLLQRKMQFSTMRRCQVRVYPHHPVSVMMIITIMLSKIHIMTVNVVSITSLI